MYNKFDAMINKRDNDKEAMQLDNYIEEIISPIRAFYSFKGVKNVPTSIILIIFVYF